MIWLWLQPCLHHFKRLLLVNPPLSFILISVGQGKFSDRTVGTDTLGWILTLLRSSFPHPPAANPSQSDIRVGWECCRRDEGRLGRVWEGLIKTRFEGLQYHVTWSGVRGQPWEERWSEQLASHRELSSCWYGISKSQAGAYLAAISPRIIELKVSNTKMEISS